MCVSARAFENICIYIYIYIFIYLYIITRLLKMGRLDLIGPMVPRCGGEHLGLIVGDGGQR